MQLVSLCENAALTWSTVNMYILYAVAICNNEAAEYFTLCM